MKARIFQHRGSGWTYKLDATPLEAEINAWFGANPGVEVREIRHDAINSFWSAPSLVVTIYYD
jgi:hypothetical protein